MQNNINHNQDVSAPGNQPESAHHAQDEAQDNGASAELEKEILTIYASRSEEEGDFWTPEYGNVDIPHGWEFLPRGEAYVTRKVKQGPHWILKGRYNRKGGYTPVKGLYAPAQAIAAAQAEATATAAKREQVRRKAQLRREKTDERYQEEFEQACLDFLDFASAHTDLAREIASSTAHWACEKHSGRVGRTSLIDLQEKAALAVRAHIRHRYTDYEDNLPSFYDYCNDELYREVRADAHLQVTRFLEKHRAKR